MQTRKGSLVESLSNTGVGFVLSLLVWEFVVKPVWEINTSFAENLSITLLFTVVSVARGYVLRRVFNQLHKNNKKDSYEHTGSQHRPCTGR